MFIMKTIMLAAMAAAGGASPADRSTGLKYNERTVAGSARDLMVVRYLRLEGTNEQIGAKLAEIARDRAVKVSFFLGRDPGGADRRTPYLEFGFTR